MLPSNEADAVSILQCVLCLLTSLLQLMLALPYPIVLLWVVWLVCTPTQIGYLLNKRNKRTELPKSGELLNGREVVAVGCVGGFILLTFITAYCCWVTFSLAGIL